MMARIKAKPPDKANELKPQIDEARKEWNNTGNTSANAQVNNSGGLTSKNIASETGGSQAPPERTLGGNGSVNPSDCDVPIPKTNAANPDATSAVDPVSASVNKGINL